MPQNLTFMMSTNCPVNSLIAKLTFGGFLIVTGLRAMSADPPGNWPAVTLRVATPGTLKDIFDAGLRPYRHPSLERTTLEVKHLRMTLIQSNGTALPEHESQVIDICPQGNGLLRYIELNSGVKSLAACRAEMLQWLPFGQPRRTEAELDAFLAAVKADHRHYDDVEKGVRDGCLTRWNDAGGIKFEVWFQKGFDPARPLALYVHVRWPRTPLERRTFYSEPIPPPPGYEHVSMQAGKDFGPDSAADDLSPAAPAAVGPSEPPEQERRSKPAVSARGGSEKWWWLAGACLVLLATILFFRRRAAATTPRSQ